MADYPGLSKAPIVEAILDIQIRIQDDLKVQDFDSVCAAISEQYPDKKKRYKLEGEIEFKEGRQSTRTEQSVYGYVLTSQDQKQIVQLRLDGYTFSRLKPYETWDKFFNEAKRLWGEYKKAVTAPEIMRIALRYINKLEIPLPIADFSEYLTAPPTVPTGVPQIVASFLTRVVVSNSEINSTAIITQALEQTTPEILPIILDIDVFKREPKGINEEEEMWDIFRKLRHFKNDIFFKSTTDKTRELCK